MPAGARSWRRSGASDVGSRVSPPPGAPLNARSQPSICARTRVSSTGDRSPSNRARIARQSARFVPFGSAHVVGGEPLPDAQLLAPHHAVGDQRRRRGSARVGPPQQRLDP